jgi:hypothetical protein
VVVIGLLLLDWTRGEFSEGSGWVLLASAVQHVWSSAETTPLRLLDPTTSPGMRYEAALAANSRVLALALGLVALAGPGLASVLRSAARRVLAGLGATGAAALLLRSVVDEATRTIGSSTRDAEADRLLLVVGAAALVLVVGALLTWFARGEGRAATICAAGVVTLCAVAALASPRFGPPWPVRATALYLAGVLARETWLTRRSPTARPAAPAAPRS